MMTNWLKRRWNAIDVKNGSLQSVLDAALQGKGITYKIEDNIVYLSAPGEPQTPQQTGQEHTVTGTVLMRQERP